MRRFILCFALLALLPRADLSSPSDRALIVVETPSPGAAAHLLQAGVVVLRDLEGYLVALATPDDLRLLDRLGATYNVVDATPENKTFYIATPIAPVIDDYGALARVLERSSFGDVIEATPAEAAQLSARGVEIARLFMTPMRPGDPGKLPPRTAPTVADSVVQAMADSVSISRVNANVQRMQDFVNRYALGDSVLSARDWIAAQFVSFGIDSVTLHQFNPGFGENVVAVHPGVGNPEKLVIVGGHYDSIALGNTVAPGADDNASGTACVLECARILSQYEFDYTLVFIAFCGEELGLFGSEAWAADAQAQGLDVVGMLNVDMIGYVYQFDTIDIDIISNASSQWLRDLLMDVAALYVPALPAVDGALPGGSNSDHASFWRHGFDAIMFYEDATQASPYIHTVNDVVGTSYISPELAEGSVKMAAALLATLAEPFRVVIRHTALANEENAQAAHHVRADVLHAGALDPAGMVLHYTIREPDVVGGILSSPQRTPATDVTVPLEYLGWGDAWGAIIPPQQPGSLVDYYIEAANTNGFQARHPKTAPDDCHRFVVGTPIVIVEDNFATDTGWVAGAQDDDALGGIWVREAPNRTYFYDNDIQPGADHTAAPDTLCWVTGNWWIEAGHMFGDVDNGKTTLFSPVYNLTGYTNASVEYYRWYSNDSGDNVDDEWVVDVSNDGGQTWSPLERLATSEREWTQVVRFLHVSLQLTAAMRFRFVAEDSGGESIVEALIDDFKLVTYTGAVTAAGNERPPRITLAQNYPNPFNPRTTIRFVVTPPGET